MPSPRKPSAERKAPTTSGPAAVRALLADLEHPHKAAIQRLRKLILGLDARVTEDVKWNAPSFLIDEHFATFKLHPPKQIQLILHTGAKAKGTPRARKIDDPDGLLAWPAKDRAVLTLASGAALRAHEASIRAMIGQWIEQL